MTMRTVYCVICKNRIRENLCGAFPDGIPKVFLFGKKKHTKPLPNQGNDVVFEPVETDEDE